MEKQSITFSGIVVQNTEQEVYYGMVKELDAVIVKGKSAEEVIDKIPKAIHSVMEAKRKNPSPKMALKNIDNLNITEHPFNYEAV